MNREQEIETFLSKIKEAYESNPNNVDSSFVYPFLCRYNVDLDEERANYRTYFNYWKNKYNDNPNLYVFEHPKQPHFLQFQNHDQLNPDDIDKTNYVKLYLSVDPKCFPEAVNTIFDYIAENKIINRSKICEYDRSDSIVLRIKEASDARKVIDFINSNELITKYARPTNPFLAREGVVGIAFDERLSYNAAISYFVSNYVKERFQLNASSDICLEDFQKYIKGFFKHTFETGENLESFRNTDYFKENLEELIKL